MYLAKSRISKTALAFLTALMTMVALVIPLVGTALAAVTTLDASPETASNPVGDNDHTITATVAADDGNASDESILFVVTSGPRADFAANGNQADGTCTTLAVAGSPVDFTCTYSNPAHTPGTDTIVVFADSNGNLAPGGNEPQDEVLKTWVGPPFSLTMTPDSDSAATGTCNAFTVTLTDEAGSAIEGATINLIRDHSSATITDDDLDPCDPGDGVAPTEVLEPHGTAEGDDEYEVGTTDASGVLTFGVRSDVAGSETIRAFFDTNSDNDFDAGEPTDTSTKTWSAGGAESVATLDCLPETDSNPTGTNHVVTCTATNGATDPVPGVTVNVTESGPATPNSDSDTTDNSGQVSFTFTSTSAGTSTITAWVDQSGGGTPGPDASEPQDTVQKTWTGAPENFRIDVTCVGTAPGFTGDANEFTNDSAVDCVNELKDKDEVFTATVTDTKNTATTADDTLAAGVTIDWAITSATSDDAPAATIDPTTCTTDANGQCTTTLNDTNPVNGEQVNVQGTIAGQVTPGTQGNNSDTATKRWESAAAETLEVTPAADVNQTGTEHAVTATVTDQFGEPVKDETVNFVVTGRNPSGTSGLGLSTAPNGTVDFTYTDQGLATVAGNDTITVTTGSGLGPVVVTKRWIPEPAVAATVPVSLISCADAQSATPDKEETNPVGATETIWAFPTTTGGEELQGHDVTFTTSMGEFVDSEGNSLGQSVVVTVDASGCADAQFTSTTAGDAIVTATIDDASDTATKHWVAGAARTIDLTPDTATNEPDTNHEITATVVDKFGNPVAGVAVTWERTGAGVFVGTPESTTNSAGEAKAVITSSSEGTTSVTGSIATTTDCDLPANDPDAGDPAGDCSDTVTKTWQTAPPPATCPGFENDPRPQFVGTDGADSFEGTDAAEIFCTFGGDDTVVANGGNDVVVLGAGADIAKGGGGDDLIRGGGGADISTGGGGDDTLRSGKGFDTLKGGSGRDTLRGGSNADLLAGGGGADSLFGGKGKDVLRGRAGNDTLRGGAGDDVLNGGGGRDSCFGGPGRDRFRNCELKRQ